MLIRLTYASRSNGALGAADVKDIVRSSQRNNTQLGITGALLLCDGVFLQCLEGDHRAVNTLYHRILLDSRHREPAILQFDEIDARLHAGWAMGLVPITDANRALILKYSPAAGFDPYEMRPRSLQLMFEELLAQARVISG
jgi:hypothetical protein